MIRLHHASKLFITMLLVSAPADRSHGQPVSPAPTSVDPPAAAGAMAPHLTTHAGAALLSWLEPIDDADSRGAYRLRFSRFENGVWGEPRTIVEGAEFFANWADVPALAGAPVLVLANKQDLPGALGAAAVAERLGLHALVRAEQSDGSGCEEGGGWGDEGAEGDGTARAGTTPGVRVGRFLVVECAAARGDDARGSAGRRTQDVR